MKVRFEVEHEGNKWTLKTNTFTRNSKHGLESSADFDSIDKLLESVQQHLHLIENAQKYPPERCPTAAHNLTAKLADKIEEALG